MRVARPAALALTALTVAGCDVHLDAVADVEPVTGVERIEMHGNAFVPAVVEVPAGTTITWVFTDGDALHNVVGDDFQSDVASNGTFAHTFLEAGRYDYSCTLHSRMDGRIIVTEARPQPRRLPRMLDASAATVGAWAGVTRQTDPPSRTGDD